MNQEIKADAGKLRLSLVPTQIIRDIAEVREYGLKKYKDAESWEQVEKQRYVDAMYRHMLDYIDNPQSVDGESGMSHLKHLACNVAFLCEMEKWEKPTVSQKRLDEAKNTLRVMLIFDNRKLTEDEEVAIEDILEYLAES